MYRGNKIGVSIPAYNEENFIKKTLSGIPGFVDAIYLVDDYSTDNTYQKACEVAKNDTRITIIKHERNLGVGGSIVSGFKQAILDEMDIITVMAGDDQMDPKYLDILIDPLIDTKIEFTKGNRLKRGYWNGMSKFRLYGNFLLSFLTKVTSGYWNIDDPQNGYVALKADSLKKIDLDNLSIDYEFENDLIIKSNIKNINILNVLIPAKYGNEISKIVYRKFIIKTSLFLIKSYFSRIWIKYIRQFHWVGILQVVSIFTLITSIVLAAKEKPIYLIPTVLVLFIPIYYDFISSILKNKHNKKTLKAKKDVKDSIF